MINLESIFNQPSPYSLGRDVKQQYLSAQLSLLDQHHRDHCVVYRHISESLRSSNWFENRLLLPVRLFKNLEIKSIHKDEVFKVLTSSGTTSQVVSKIYLNRETAALQSKVLVKIMQNVLGVARRPMLIIDSPTVIKDRQSFSARGAGILGLSTFGKLHTYALNEDMSIDIDTVTDFILRCAGQPIFIFGFTFMIWKYFFQEIQKRGIKFDLPGSIMIHSGGWKKLEDIAVDNTQFKSAAFDLCHIEKVYNFYGMVEQVGSIFLECDQGYLHAPDYADVDVIDLYSTGSMPQGKVGVLAVSSLLPWSYPGHRLLTEDIGVVIGEDDCKCGRQGKYFLVQGRIPSSEPRGCSDTHTR